jgi:dodecin
MSVINTIDLTGISAESWGHAVNMALAEASRTIRNINRIDVLNTSAVVEGSAVTEYHTEIRIYFEIER